jgi:hypothetical protein
MAAAAAPRAERRVRLEDLLVSVHHDRILRMEGSGRTAIVRVPAAASAADVLRASRAVLDASADAESTR